MAAMKKVMKASAMKVKPMKVMKAAMKATPMKAMKKAMKVSIIARGRMAKAMVYNGRRVKTVGGMTASDLMKNKNGKIVSKKASRRGKQNAFMIAASKARKALGITGFVPCGGKTPEGKALYA